MGTARHQYTDEFKREAVGLLASSGQPLSQIDRDPADPCGFMAYALAPLCETDRRQLRRQSR